MQRITCARPTRMQVDSLKRVKIRSCTAFTFPLKSEIVVGAGTVARFSAQLLTGKGIFCSTPSPSSSIVQSSSCCRVRENGERSQGPVEYKCNRIRDVKFPSYGFLHTWKSRSANSLSNPELEFVLMQLKNAGLTAPTSHPPPGSDTVGVLLNYKFR